MGKHARLEVHVGSYGFGYEWTLVLPATKTKREYHMWLGQDHKFCERVIGSSVHNVLLDAGVPEHRMPLNPYATWWQNKVAAYIVAAAGGMRNVRNMQPWDLCGQ